LDAWCKNWTIKINEDEILVTYLSRGFRPADSHLPSKEENIPFANRVKYIGVNSYKMTNKLEKYSISLLFHCFLAAVHVSSDVIAHYQEHLICSYSFWFYSRVSSSAADMAEVELSS